MNESKSIRRSRRAFTQTAAVASVTPFMIWSRKASAATQVVVRTPGGVFDDVKRETVYEPFKKETGIEVVPVAATVAKLLAMMKSGQSELDVIDTGDNALLELERLNYLRAIPYDDFKYTNPADIDAVVKRKNQLGSFIYAMVMAYNTKMIKPENAPKSWADFWDVAKIPGRRTLADMASGSVGLEYALLADGVPMDKLYPLDIDRALKVMSRIRSSIPKFWDTGALSTTMLTNGEVAMGSIWSTRAQASMGEGAPINISWNQNALLVQAYGIPSNTKNVEAARKYIDYASSAEVQSRWLAKYKAIPVNTKSYGATSKDLIDPATGTPWTKSKGFLLDIAWWADNRNKVNDAWSKWIVGR
jgi:putative spermidine/putrescine transport system substrate-binding protein